MSLEGYKIGIDVGIGRDVSIEERYMKPSGAYPKGSYLRLVDGKVEVATGYYEKEYPGHPSPYWHGGPPFVVYQTEDWPWANLSRSGKLLDD